jgi:uncharacterized repeat protein (TIGR01451 family)
MIGSFFPFRVPPRRARIRGACRQRKPSSHRCSFRLERLEARVTPSLLGTFELDANVTTGVLGASGSTTTSHDWDQVYADNSVNPPTKTSGALASTFVTDKVNSNGDDIFTGGGSKDTLGIQQGKWLFTTSKPQGKDDITHAYAAAYTDPTNDHLILYAGLDRFDNSGDATAGFWFFHNPVTENPNVTQNGGHPFTGAHTDGDILLVSDFTVGGSTSTIKVFRWTGDDATGSLVALNNGNPIAGSTFAIVNSGPISVPWSYTNKSGAHSPAAGEFLEEGVDLTALGLDGCFSAFLAETRSSQSPTATLSDFVTGSFPLCSVTATPFTGLSKIGDTTVYPLTVKNTGAGPLYLQNITDTLLGNIVLNGVVQAPVGPVTSIDASQLAGNNPLAPGASFTILVSRVVQASDPDPTTNTTSFAFNDEPDFSSAAVTTSVDDSVNLFQPSATLTVTASPTTALHLGDPITYTYKVTNTSSADSPNLVLSTSNPNTSFVDTLLGNLTADAVAAGGGSLAPGASFSFTETRNVQAGDPTPLVNMATVHFALAQNLGSFSNIITAQGQSSVTLVPHLVITKAVTPGFASVIHPGDTASFTITVTDDGAGPASNVAVSDHLPAADELTWKVDSSTFDTNSIGAGDVLSASKATLAAGASVSVVVSAVVPLDIFGTTGAGNGDPLPLGLFELDGNATTGVLGTSGSTTTSHDWDQVYNDVTNGTSTSGAIAASFVTDKVSSGSDDIFTGGGSKDTLGIQQGKWLFTTSKPQAKDDIGHAFAGLYVDPSTADSILVAGLDRFDNSGDATAGFWFLQNSIGENPNVTQNGGHPFTGTHADGDILLVSDFTVGGSTSTIKVFRWTGDDATGSLVALNNGNPITGSTFAIVNSGPISVPWSFTDKSHKTSPAAGEFLEEGVNLSALGLGGCFASFIAETRSSQSPTATLSDFVTGTFNTCQLDLPNTASLTATNPNVSLTSNQVIITVDDGHPLLATSAGGGAATDGPTPQQLQAALAQGIDAWSAAGIDPARLSNLANVAIRVGDLPRTELGYATPGVIWIDQSAAGWGWSSDGAPGRVDLATVVTHELGHALGFDDGDPGVMEAALAPGVRLAPAALTGIGIGNGTGSSTGSAVVAGAVMAGPGVGAGAIAIAAPSLVIAGAPVVVQPGVPVATPERAAAGDATSATAPRLIVITPSLVGAPSHIEAGTFRDVAGVAPSVVSPSAAPPPFVLAGMDREAPSVVVRAARPPVGVVERDGGREALSRDDDPTAWLPLRDDLRDSLPDLGSAAAVDPLSPLRALPARFAGEAGLAGSPESGTRSPQGDARDAGGASKADRIESDGSSPESDPDATSSAAALVLIVGACWGVHRAEARGRKGRRLRT